MIYPNATPEFRYLERQDGITVLQIRYVHKQNGYTGAWNDVPVVKEHDANNPS